MRAWCAVRGDEYPVYVDARTDAGHWPVCPGGWYGSDQLRSFHTLSPRTVWRVMPARFPRCSSVCARQSTCVGCPHIGHRWHVHGHRTAVSASMSHPWPSQFGCFPSRHSGFTIRWLAITALPVAIAMVAVHVLALVGTSLGPAAIGTPGSIAYRFLDHQESGDCGVSGPIRLVLPIPPPQQRDSEEHQDRYLNHVYRPIWTCLPHRVQS
jgi:hypothetical protein